MKLKILFPALCALMISFVGCKKDEPDKDTKGPKLNVYEIEADAAGGEYQIQLTSPSSWNALPDKKWVSVDPYMGIGNAIVTVKVESGIESDTAKVRFINDAGVQILIVYRTVQGKEPNEPNEPDANKDQNAPQLSMNEIPTTIAGGEYQIQVTSPRFWFAQSNKEWVTMDMNIWTGDTIVTIKVEEGPNGDTATVLFNNEFGSQYLIVYRTVQGKANGGFSVAENKQVKFAPGNLQYQAITNTWRFAEHQYDIIGSANSKISNSYIGWIDLFGWGTGNNPTNGSTLYSKYSTFVDWGANRIGSYPAYTWRTLNSHEWVYLFEKRPHASQLYGTATVNGKSGLVVIPDNTLTSVGFKAGMRGFSENTYSSVDWEKLESVGCLFLPASGTRYGTDMSKVGDHGRYWSRTPYSEEFYAYGVYFNDSGLYPQATSNRSNGQAVRLAQDL